MLYKITFLTAVIVSIRVFMPVNIFQVLNLPLVELEIFTELMAQNISSLLSYLEIFCHASAILLLIKSFLYFSIVNLNYQVYKLIINFLR